METLKTRLVVLNSQKEMEKHSGIFKDESERERRSLLQEIAMLKTGGAVVRRKGGRMRELKHKAYGRIIGDLLKRKAKEKMMKALSKASELLSERDHQIQALTDKCKQQLQSLTTASKLKAASDGVVTRLYSSLKTQETKGVFRPDAAKLKCMIILYKPITSCYDDIRICY